MSCVFVVVTTERGRLGVIYDEMLRTTDLSQVFGGEPEVGEV